MSRRTERIAEQLREEVARILREETSDPRIHLVTLTRVDVAPDLSQARIHWSALGATQPPELEEIARGLESAAPFVRGRLARVLPTRRTPALHFRHDPSLELGSRTLEVLKALADEE